MTCSCWLEAVHNRVQGYPSHDKQTANSGISSAAWEVANLGLVRPPGISGFTHLRGVDPSRSAIAISSENAWRATWSSARRHGHRAVLSLGCEIPGSWHSRARPKAHTVTVRARPYRFGRNPSSLAFSIFQLSLDYTASVRRWL